MAREKKVASSKFIFITIRRLYVEFRLVRLLALPYFDSTQRVRDSCDSRGSAAWHGVARRGAATRDVANDRMVSRVREL